MSYYIERPVYFEKIKPYIGKPLIKVFTGQRRVGKSFLMYQTIDYLKALHKEINIIYIDKESFEFDHINDYKDLTIYIKQQTKKGKNALFIDEIQDIQQFEKSLRSLYKDPDMDVYITGSNATMLSGELATVLSGRYIKIPVRSLSYKEYLDFYKLQPAENNFYDFLKYGGLPGLIHLEKKEPVVFEYLRNVSETVIYRDIIRRNSIRNVAFLENLIKYLAENLGSMVSAKKIADFLKSQRVSVSPNLVLDYLKYLSEAYIIQKLKRIDVKGKKIFDIG